MASNFRKFSKGIRILPVTTLLTTPNTEKGDLQVLNSDGKLYYNDGSSNSALVTESGTQTLTNKTLTNPTISNFTVFGSTIQSSVSSNININGPINYDIVLQTQGSGSIRLVPASGGIKLQNNIIESEAFTPFIIKSANNADAILQSQGTGDVRLESNSDIIINSPSGKIYLNTDSAGNVDIGQVKLEGQTITPNGTYGNNLSIQAQPGGNVSIEDVTIYNNNITSTSDIILNTNLDIASQYGLKSNGSKIYSLLRTVYFISGVGGYSPTSRVKMLIVELVGGGGGGGGAFQLSSGALSRTVIGGAGGSGGRHVFMLKDFLSTPPNFTYSVGAGGAGGGGTSTTSYQGDPGDPGNPTQLTLQAINGYLAGSATANGGFGGTVSSAISPYTSYPLVADGVSGGENGITGTFYTNYYTIIDLNNSDAGIAGRSGTSSLIKVLTNSTFTAPSTLTNTFRFIVSRSMGGSPYSNGTTIIQDFPTGATTSAPISPTFFGEGGMGACVIESTTTGNSIGASGKGGYIKIWEYV